jgi:hypothetical protein
MRYLTERLVQIVFFLVGVPFSRLFSLRCSPEINVMKWSWIPGFRARRLASCAHSTNRGAEPALGAVTPGNPHWVNNAIPRLAPGSIGFLWRNCLQHLRWRHAELGFR